MLIDKLDQIPISFKSGYRGIMLLHRSKDGSRGNAQRKAIKKISSNPEEWTTIVHEFKELQKNTYQGYRIYASVNSRNLDKAIHEFKTRQLFHDYGNVQELHWFYQDIQNRFFSCLMNPSCRIESNFLIDCDSPEEYSEVLRQMPMSSMIMDYETKSGRHIITTPFNPTGYTFTVKKDEMLYIG